MPRKFEVEADLDADLETDYENVDMDDGPYEFEDYAAMGINPLKPTGARPGTEEKVLMLSARYAAGVPLWHESDCYDHGPGETELMGSISQVRQAPQPLVEVED